MIIFTSFSKNLCHLFSFFYYLGSVKTFLGMKIGYRIAFKDSVLVLRILISVNLATFHYIKFSKFCNIQKFLKIF